MKTILEINNNNYGSTGTIMLNIAKKAKTQGFNVFTACKNSKQSKKFKNQNHIYIGFWLDRIISEKLAYLTGLKDHFNIINTYIFLKQIDEIHPDLIHLHNIHDTFLNLNLFFSYIKEKQIPIVWTFHDCYPFTGQCTCFELIKCNKWKTGCGNCSQINQYPDSLFDQTNKQWKRKKNWFVGIKNLVIVSPSIWLKNLISESFLKEYQTTIINNGIDLNLYKPHVSHFKQQYFIEDKIVILGVATSWRGKRKGLDVFIELAKKLSNKYQIVLVGTTADIDRILPLNIISIHKTYNARELVEIYNGADIFVNPTREDNFPTVNIEALACGLPVVTYDTGGSSEAINSSCGFVVEKDNIDKLISTIEQICGDLMIKKENCRTQAENFSNDIKYQEYIDLYKRLLNY